MNNLNKHGCGSSERTTEWIIIISEIEHCGIRDWALWHQRLSIVASEIEHCGFRDWALWHQWLTIVVSVIKHYYIRVWVLWHQRMSIVASLIVHCAISEIEHCGIRDWTLWHHRLNLAASQTEHYGITDWTLRHHRLNIAASQTEHWCIRDWTLWYQRLNIVASQTEHCGIIDWTLRHLWRPEHRRGGCTVGAEIIKSSGLSITRTLQPIRTSQSISRGKEKTTSGRLAFSQAVAIADNGANYIPILVTLRGQPCRQISAAVKWGQLLTFTGRLESHFSETSSIPPVNTTPHGGQMESLWRKRRDLELSVEPSTPHNYI